MLMTLYVMSTYQVLLMIQMLILQAYLADKKNIHDKGLGRVGNPNANASLSDRLRAASAELTYEPTT